LAYLIETIVLGAAELKITNLRLLIVKEAMSVELIWINLADIVHTFVNNDS
jgi:hypothetical protein